MTLNYAGKFALNQIFLTSWPCLPRDVAKKHVHTQHAIKGTKTKREDMEKCSAEPSAYSPQIPI